MRPFLETIRSTGNVRLAASAARISRSTPYQRARRDPEFSAAWDEANEDAVDLLEATARQRALGGSDQLLMFLLRAHRPDRYRDSHGIRIDVRRVADRIGEELGTSGDALIGEADRRLEEPGR